MIDINSFESEQLEWAIRALAQPAEIQIALFPEFVCTADELALEFEKAEEAFGKSDRQRLLNPGQEAAMKALDDHLDSMGGPEHAELWTNEGLRIATEWTLVRSLAAKVSSEMGWSNEAPPPSSALYVGPGLSKPRMDSGA